MSFNCTHGQPANVLVIKGSVYQDASVTVEILNLSHVCCRYVGNGLLLMKAMLLGLWQQISHLLPSF